MGTVQFYKLEAVLMQYDRRGFLKKVAVFCLLLIAPFMALWEDFAAPTDDVQKFMEHYGLEDGDDEILGGEEIPPEIPSEDSL